MFFQLQIPTNAKPGDTISQQMDNGTIIMFTVPPGAVPGTIIKIPIQNQTVSQNNNNNLNSLNDNTIYYGSHGGGFGSTNSPILQLLHYSHKNNKKIIPISTFKP